MPLKCWNLLRAIVNLVYASQLVVLKARPCSVWCRRHICFGNPTHGLDHPAVVAIPELRTSSHHKILQQAAEKAQNRGREPIVNSPHRADWLLVPAPCSEPNQHAANGPHDAFLSPSSQSQQSPHFNVSTAFQRLSLCRILCHHEFGVFILR